MITKLRMILLIVIACLVSAFVSRPVVANNSEKSRRVTLLQLTCFQDPSGGTVNGPGTVFLTGSGTCDGFKAIPTPLPSGTISNMRVAISGGSYDSTATLQVEIWTGAIPHPVLICESTNINSENPSCQDLTHSASIKAGDSLFATVTIPDSNTFVASVAISVEENLI